MIPKRSEIYIKLDFLVSTDKSYISLKNLFIIWTIGSSFLHFRTFFLMPRYSVVEDENYSVYKNSFVGLKMSKNNEYKNENNEKTENDHAAEVKTNFTVSLKSPLYWQFLVCFTILSFRIKSIQGISKSSEFFWEKIQVGYIPGLTGPILKRTLIRALFLTF